MKVTFINRMGTLHFRYFLQKLYLLFACKYTAKLHKMSFLFCEKTCINNLALVLYFCLTAYPVDTKDKPVRFYKPNRFKGYKKDGIKTSL
jgi:hypothetical protein